RVHREAEQVIVDTILDERPDDAVLGEEATERAGRSGVRWIGDPLDGTPNYLYGYPGYGVSRGRRGRGGRACCGSSTRSTARRTTSTATRRTACRSASRSTASCGPA